MKISSGVSFRAAKVEVATQDTGLMERFFGIVLTMMVVLLLLGFVLAHLAIAIALLLAASLIGRHLRRHGV